MNKESIYLFIWYFACGVWGKDIKNVMTPNEFLQEFAMS